MRAPQGAWALLSAACLLAPQPSAAVGLDSSRVRLEFGFATDVTNEQYVEETYSDTTFLSRSLRDVPETRRAGVAAMEWVSRAASGRWGMRWRPEVSIGDRARRASAAGRLDWLPDERSAWSLEPRFEWRDDESFGLERREWRGDLRARHRRAWSETDRVEFSAGGEWLEASGQDISLLLDRRVGRAAARWTHLPLFGWEWGMRLSAEARAFPDSSDRDHVEAEWGAEARRLFGGAQSLSSALELSRRSARREVASTRDRFWAPRASLALDLRSETGARLHWSAEGEAIRYDRPEEAAYFDYELLRTRLDLERDIGGGWAARVGPRLEWLLSAGNASERYAQTGVGIECERVTDRSWWSLGPEAGWRQYERETDRVVAQPGVHSSFAYYGVMALTEATWRSAWRLRLTADARIEKHRDASQDARSLYFSLDVRRLLAPS